MIELSNQFYMTNWDEGSVKFRKNLIFAMARLQKPVVTTIGKFGAADTKAYLEVSVAIAKEMHIGKIIG